MNIMAQFIAEITNIISYIVLQFMLWNHQYMYFVILHFNFNFISHLVLLVSRNESINRIHAIQNPHIFLSTLQPCRVLCDIATSCN